MQCRASEASQQTACVAFRCTHADMQVEALNVNTRNFYTFENVRRLFAKGLVSPLTNRLPGTIPKGKDDRKFP